MALSPQLENVVAAMRPRPSIFDDIAATRSGFEELMSRFSLDDDRAVDVREITTTSPDGNEVTLRLCRPAGVSSTELLPVVYNIHGGGFAYGSRRSGDKVCGAIVKQLGFGTASVEYRLSPEHPHPAAVVDSYAGLRWLAEHGAEHGFDTARIAVNGTSAGGLIAAVMALMSRDRGGPPIVLQSLRVPLLDDDFENGSAAINNDQRFVSGQSLPATWERYYRGDAGLDPSYARPLRAADTSDLPPAFIQTAELDPIRDQGIRYAQRLMDSGVSVELYNVGGAFHFFEAFAPDSELAQTLDGLWLSALRRALS